MNKAEQSKQRIADALIRLLKTIPYNEITIQMITQEADVSRMAFYRNFESKDQIIRYYIDRQADAFIGGLRPEPGKGFDAVFYRNLVSFLSGARETGLLLIRADLFDLMRSEFDRIYEVSGANIQDRLRFRFIAGGICNVYYYWLVNGCKEAPDDLSETLQRVLAKI